MAFMSPLSSVLRRAYGLLGPLEQDEPFFTQPVTPTAPQAASVPAPVAAPVAAPTDPWAAMDWQQLYVPTAADIAASQSTVSYAPGVNFGDSGIDTSSFLTPGYGSGDSSVDAYLDPDKFRAWLDANGYQVSEASAGGKSWARGISDAQGDWVVKPTISPKDANMPLLALAALGGAALAGGGAATAGADLGATYGSGYGGLGTADAAAGLVGGGAGPGAALTAPGAFTAGGELMTGSGLLTLPAASTMPMTPAPVESLLPIVPETAPLLPQVADVGIKTLPAASTLPLTPSPVDPLPMPDVTPAVAPTIPAIDPIMTLPNTLPQTPAPVDPLPAPDVGPAVAPTLPNVPGQNPLDWLKANPEFAKLLFTGLGAAAGGAGGSSSGGTGYTDNGYRPNVTRGGFMSSVAPTLQQPRSVAPRGLISIPGTTGYENSGLWRYGLLGGK
jgi:hypothetical protein